MAPAVVDDDFQQEMAALDSATVIGAERKPGVFVNGLIEKQKRKNKLYFPTMIVPLNLALQW